MLSMHENQKFTSLHRNKDCTFIFVDLVWLMRSGLGMRLLRMRIEIGEPVM